MGEKRVNLTSEAKFVTEAARVNPKLGWLEFILTDDQPNSNRQGIKKESFSSLIDTGQYMPIKMALGEIAPDHNEAAPLGVIATLEKQDTKVLGKAAVWKSERGSDYDMLKAMSAKGEPIHISWEIAYLESKTVDDVEWITDPILTAATIVGLPAYGTRTPVISVASENQEEPPEEEDDEEEDGNNEALKEAEAKFEKRLTKLEEELGVLRAYKEQREKEDADDALLAARLQNFTEAGFEFSDEDVEAKREVWLEMTDGAFGEMLDMMKSVQAASASVPNVSGTASKTNLEIVRAGLKKMRKGNSEEN